ncbi:MAG: DUF3106 domain-containing protein [Stagnimonas sp.]|nr:DUF3106 domain-containing protein [Stagnimonas sp.]
MRPDARQALAALLLAVVAPVFAAGPDWGSLSAEQQALVAPAIKGGATEFNQLPEPRRQKLAEGARRWLEMNPEQRLEASKQFDSWQHMSNSERRAALERRERFRQLPRAEQESLLRQQRRFDTLPAPEQQRLREAFRMELEHRASTEPMNLPPTDSLLPPSLPPLPPLPPPATTTPSSPTTGLLPQ